MSLKERVYSVLVVSASHSFNASLADILPTSKYYPVSNVASVSAAKRSVVERVFDFIMINSPLPDDTGINFAIDISVRSSTVVLIIVRSDVHDEIYDKVAEHGVFTIPKPTSKSSMIQALRWLASSRERLRKSEKRSLSFEEKMEEIRIVNRAKLLLISELKMSEPNAHHYIQKQAMDRCISCKEVAENIILTYS